MLNRAVARVGMMVGLFVGAVESGRAVLGRQLAQPKTFNFHQTFTDGDPGRIAESVRRAMEQGPTC